MERRHLLKAACFAGAAFPAISLADEGLIKLDSFPVYKQEMPYTCGPSSCRMVLEYLGVKLPEAEIAKAMGTKEAIGTSHSMYIKGYEKFLAEHETGLHPTIVKGEDGDVEMVREKVKEGLPVVASFLTENHFKPGTAVGHYCVLIGHSLKFHEFVIANPFGYVERMGVDKFWRLAKWWPDKGDIPEVPWWRTPHVPFMKRTLIVLEKKQ